MLNIVDYAISLIYAIDIIINSRTSFFLKETGEQVKDPKKISKHYFSSKYFLIDFIAALPLVLSGRVLEAKFVAWLEGVKFIKLFRLQWEVNQSNKSEKMKLTIKMLSLFSFLMLYIHSTACIFYFVINSDREWHPPQAKYSEDVD